MGAEIRQNRRGFEKRRRDNCGKSRCRSDSKEARLETAADHSKAVEVS